MKIYNKIKFLFSKDLFVTFSGTTISQLIPILLSPLTTRIYSPSDFGLLGIYMSISSVLNTFSTLQYANAVLLTKNKAQEDNLVLFSILNSLVLAIATFICLLLVKHEISSLLNAAELENWLLTLPLCIILTGFISTYTKKLNKYKKYKFISSALIANSITTTIITLWIGYFFYSSVGLLVGFISGQIINSIVLFIGIKDIFINLKNIKLKYMKLLLNKHYKFPMYSLPTEFLFNWTTNLPVYFMSLFYNQTIIGWFNYGRRMTTIPVTFITKSVGLVFAQQATEEYNIKKNCTNTYKKTLKSLAIILAPPFLLLLFFGPIIFEIVFGSNWRVAGEYVQILSIMFYIRAITSPLTYIFTITNRQNEDFWLHVISLVIISISLYFSSLIFKDIKLVLILYSLTYSLIYLYYLYRSYILSKNKL